jgi:uncharacterized protein
MTALRHEADEILLGFARALRAAGVPVTQDRAMGYADAVALVGLDDRRATYWAGRSTLCAGPDDLATYDQVFAAWFEGLENLPDRGRDADAAMPMPTDLPEVDGNQPGDQGDDVTRALASSLEVLRHRDLSAVPDAERRRLTALFATLRPHPPLRRSARHRPWHRGDLDASRTLRNSLRRMGEPGEVARRRRTMRPRRIVLLVDVSGSMGGYADPLLRLAHRFVVSTGASTEVFTVGTRLTRITRALRQRDPERALVAAGATVPDWSGGTRLGETLRSFLDRWGARGMARGAVVVVFSDGWERGDPRLLAEQVARLHRIAHRVVWVNPHRGKEGYLPLQQGIVAVLPHVDHFLAGHSLATYADLVEVVSRA